MRRLEDWDQRLAQAIETARATPFVWGESDCCLWVAGVVQSLTGEDFAQGWRGTYCDARSAYRRLTERGGLTAVVSEALGHPVKVMAAQRGDVVYARLEGGPALGVVVDHRAAFKSGQGVELLPLAACDYGWSVGHG